MTAKQQTIEKFISDLVELIPQNLDELKVEMETNLRTGMESLFRKMDLVSREEYDVQTELLKRTRALVEELNQRVAELEKDRQQEL